MIVSSDKKFIFIHVPKTGGSSIGLCLGKYCDNFKDYPELGKVHDFIRSTYPDVGYEHPKNMEIIQNAVQNIVKVVDVCDIITYYKNRRGEIGWQNIINYQMSMHTPISNKSPNAAMVVDCINQRPDYFKFAFVRDPWDYVLSVYKNKIVGDVMLAGSPVEHFDEIIKTCMTPNAFNDFIKYIEQYPNIIKNFMNSDKCQMDYITDYSGKVMVDHIARYEDFDAELEFIAEKLEIPELNPDIWVNTINRDRYKYTDFYSVKSRGWVENIFRKDIRKLGYSYGVQNIN